MVMPLEQRPGEVTVGAENLPKETGKRYCLENFVSDRAPLLVTEPVSAVDHGSQLPRCNSRQELIYCSGQAPDRRK